MTVQSYVAHITEDGNCYLVSEFYSESNLVSKVKFMCGIIIKHIVVWWKDERLDNKVFI